MKKKLIYWETEIKTEDGLPCWKGLYDENDGDKAIYIQRNYKNHIALYI